MVQSFFIGGGEGNLSQSLRSFGGMSKQSTELFFCRLRPRVARCSLPFLVRFPFFHYRIKRKALPCGSAFFLLVEARGIEPLSKNLSPQASPSADGLLKFSRRLPSVRLTVPKFLLHDGRENYRPFTFIAKMTPLLGRDAPRSDGSLIRLQMQLYCCQLILSCGF